MKYSFYTNVDYGVEACTADDDFLPVTDIILVSATTMLLKYCFVVYNMTVVILYLQKCYLHSRSKVYFQ